VCNLKHLGVYMVLPPFILRSALNQAARAVKEPVGSLIWPGRFYVMSYGLLCEFLDVLVPDVPFPRVNDTKSWRAHVAKLKMKEAMNVLKVLAGLGVVVVGVYLGLRGWDR
jgi:hypothetical protein